MNDEGKDAEVWGFWRKLERIDHSTLFFCMMK